MLLSFTSLTLLRQTQSIRAENDTRCHHENQDIKLVLIPLQRANAPPQKPQATSFRLRNSTDSLSPLPSLLSLSLVYCMFQSCVCGQAWMQYEVPINQMNSRFIFFLSLSLQSIKGNSVCFGFLSMLLVDRDVWLVEREWLLFLFIYL